MLVHANLGKVMCTNIILLLFQSENSKKNGTIKSYRTVTQRNVSGYHTPAKNKMFCFPCMLFADKGAHGYEKAFADVSAWYQNFKKGKEKIINHENSSIHEGAVSKLLVTNYNLEQNATVVKGLVEGRRVIN